MITRSISTTLTSVVIVVIALSAFTGVVAYVSIRNQSTSNSLGMQTTRVSSSSQTSTSTSSSCSGYPPGGNCHANYSFEFPVAVQYSGDWILNYTGYDNESSIYTRGSYQGTGYNATTITLSGDNFSPLTICATATKLDNSSSTLTLLVNYDSANTTAPFGTVTKCEGVAP
jgi:hypothetical protein